MAGRTFLLLCLLLAATTAEDDGIALFDGRSLAGWDGDPACWTVEDGAIVGRTTADHPLAHNTFLVWSRGEVDDFELTLSFRIEGGNSGIQYRSRDLGDHIVAGYQADMDAAGEWLGCLYEERGRGLLARRGDAATVGAGGAIAAERLPAVAGPPAPGDGWSRYRILARGHTLTQEVDGLPTCAVVDEQVDRRAASGVLALQLHAGPPMTVRFKDIRLKRLKLAEGRKLVLVAGEPSHGPGEHELPAGVHALRRCFDRVPGFVAAEYGHGWPEDPTAFANADAVFFYLDGGGGHPLLQGERLQAVEALAAAGVGLGFAHYGLELPKDHGAAELTRWIGGTYESGFSANPVWTADFAALPEHPITRGVAPFSLRDEWYFNLRFLEPDPDRVPILVATPGDEVRGGAYSGSGPYPHIVAAAGRAETVMWAVDRPGRNRGFGFTGGHFHANWADASVRALVLNAIAWTAHAEIPADGIRAAPSDEDLAARLRPGSAPAKGPDVAKAAFSSPVVRSGSVAIDVPLAGATSLWLYVDDGGDGFACDWADWIEPRLVKDDGSEIRLVDLRWSQASAGWGEARVGRNASGGELRLDGAPITDGIGTHATSLIRFDVGPGFARFRARGGVDDGGTAQHGGTSVRFHVFTVPP